ncbi:MAG TPA: SAVED domain-containing protein [Terracidiphilus sp.]|nr:SAVED domain-containing protein [Terracidiphilus sp.]
MSKGVGLDTNIHKYSDSHPLSESRSNFALQPTDECRIDDVEPQTWAWPSAAAFPDYVINEPSVKGGKAALVLSLSATIDPKRITSVIGEDASIWSITVPRPHNDLIKSREQLGQLRAILRRMFDQIKVAHGQHEALHVFPAAPVSACVEFGRVRMPKADMPWQIYDQVNSLGGFVSALTIS